MQYCARLLAEYGYLTTYTDEDPPMATYTCDKCGMSVNMTCGECDSELVNDTITTDAGVEVQVSKCPEGHGKIKSPMCCGDDMMCDV